MLLDNCHRYMRLIVERRQTKVVLRFVSKCIPTTPLFMAEISFLCTFIAAFSKWFKVLSCPRILVLWYSIDCVTSEKGISLIRTVADPLSYVTKCSPTWRVKVMEWLPSLWRTIIRFPSCELHILNLTWRRSYNWNTLRALFSRISTISSTISPTSAVSDDLL